MSALAVAARHAALMEYARECRHEAMHLDVDVDDTIIRELMTEALYAEAAAFQLRREGQGQGHQEDAA